MTGPSDVIHYFEGPTSEAQALYYCRRCDYPATERVRRCPACRGLYTIIPKPARVRAEEKRVRTTVVPTDGVPAPDVPRLFTGWPSVDAVFGGGIARGSVTMLWGDPGVGKTTFLLQLAARIPAERPVYIQTEQSAAALQRTAQKIGAVRRDFDIVVTDNLDDATAHVARVKSEFVVFDSVTMLAEQMSESKGGALRHAKRISRAMIRLAQDRDITVVLVFHLTTMGTTAGGTFSLYGVDTHVNYLGDLDDPSGYRYVRSRKNRHGPSGVVARMRMGAKGLEEAPEPPKPTAASAGSAAAPPPAPPAETSPPDGPRRQRRDRAATAGARARRVRKDGGA